MVANGSLTIRGNVTGTQFSVLYLYGNPIRFEATSTVDVDIISQFEGTTIFNGHMARGKVQFGSLRPFHAGVFGGTGTAGQVFADYNAVLSPGEHGAGMLATGDLTATAGFINIHLGGAAANGIDIHGMVNFRSYQGAPGATLPHHSRRR